MLYKFFYTRAQGRQSNLRTCVIYMYTDQRLCGLQHNKTFVFYNEIRVYYIYICIGREEKNTLNSIIANKYNII